MPDWSRGRTLSSRARGETTDSHGPLQRLLEGSLPYIRQVPCHSDLQKPDQHRIHELVLVRDIEAYEASTLEVRLISLQEAVSV